MIDQPTFDTLLQRVDALGRELEKLRRDLLRGAAGAANVHARKPTLYGTVKAGDVSDEMIEEAQRNLLRPLDDL
ncbi:MAG: hypothetical protein U0X20_22180 [Caldilineaceae bacterium]